MQYVFHIILLQKIQTDIIFWRVTNFLDSDTKKKPNKVFGLEKAC